MRATIDTTTEIRPFSVEISQEQIDTLRLLTVGPAWWSICST
jgi:hypothetical protein